MRELIQSARDYEAQGAYGQAFRAFQTLCALLDTAPEKDPISEVRAGLWRLNPLWWANIQHGGLCLRRCEGRDATFFLRCFKDEDFVYQFNRQHPWRGDLTVALEKSGKLPPMQTGLLMWVVESSCGQPIGLASLSSIDVMNQRAEFSIGLPGEKPSTIGIKASLMMLHFALVMMPFNKVYAYIYEDNPKALHNALRLGFDHEGKLHEHFRIPGHGFVSVHVIGLNRTKLHSDPGLKLLARRRIGQEW